MISDLARTRGLGGEEREEIETVPVEPRRSNCSTPSVNSTSALEDMLPRMESRLSQGQSELETRLTHNLSQGQSELESRLTHNFSQGQQLLAQETSVALDKLTESQAQLSYQLIAQTAESAEAESQRDPMAGYLHNPLHYQ